MNELKIRVDSLIERLRREDVNMHGFILSVKGKTKAKAYYPPFKEGQPHRMYSVSKTFTGIAVGMLIDDGLLTLDSRITEFFPEWKGEDPHGWLAIMTIRDMLRMATCHRYTYYREGTDEDWSKPFFTHEPTHKPGTVFHYDTGCSQALAALVKRLSGKEAIDFLEERLFKPLGLSDEKYWLRDPAGTCQGGTGLCMSLRDMHEVAQCCLEGGKGIIPEWYCREMGKCHTLTLLQTPEEGRYGYGWQCWRTRAGWAMYGLGGQLSIVCPDKSTVLSTIADTRLDPIGVQRIYNAFFDEVYPYIDKEDMDEICFAPHPQTLVSHDEYVYADDGRFDFEEGNPLGLKQLCLGNDCIVYENALGQIKIPFTLGENISVQFPGYPDVPGQVQAAFVGERTFRLRAYAIGDSPCGFDMLLKFDADTVTVLCRKSYDFLLTQGYEGVATGLRGHA